MVNDLLSLPVCSSVYVDERCGYFATVVEITKGSSFREMEMCLLLCLHYSVAFTV